MMEEEKKKRKRKPDRDGADGKKMNWQQAYATTEEIERFLSDNIYLRYNEVTRRTECRLPEADYFMAHARAPDVFEGLVTIEWQPISDRIVNSMVRAMSKEVKPVRKQDMLLVIESDYTVAYNPFTYYLDHLPPWDGHSNYILELSASVNVKGSVDEQMFFYKCLEKWLVGMVAGWVDPEAVNHLILILVGEQGTYKTTWFSYLLPPELRRYFRIKTNSSTISKDDLLTLTEYGLVCYEELDTMSGKELNQLKSAVTMPSVDERAPYAHFAEHRRHIASFCGTGNNAQFLSDTTGNRRWLPFEVESIQSPRDYPLNYEGIYAQAYALWQQDYQYWVAPQETVCITAHNRQFETPRPEAELIDWYFRKPDEERGERGEFIPVSLAMQVIGGNTTAKLSTVMLGRAFRQLGFRGVNNGQSRGYIVVRRTPEEIETRKRLPTTDG